MYFNYLKLHIVNCRPATKINLTSISDMLREEMKWNHIKCSTETREGRRRWGKDTKNTSIIIFLKLQRL